MPGWEAFGGWGLDFLPPPAAGHEATMQRSTGRMAHGGLKRGIFVELRKALNLLAFGARVELLLQAPPIALCLSECERRRV